MFHRRQVVQNRVVAKAMRQFFRGLKYEHQLTPAKVALAYGKHLWDPSELGFFGLAREQSRSRLNVGLSIGSSSQDLEVLTKRAALISDTLLLSHDRLGNYHEIGRGHPPGSGKPFPFIDDISALQILTYGNFVTYGILCSDIVGLGRWIVDAGPLLKAGLAWYLPNYKFHGTERSEQEPERQKKVGVTDFLIRDGRAVDVSGTEPIKSQLVRLVMRVELPFIEGVDLRDFSKITIEEFASYSGFRDFLRQRFLDMDVAVNDSHSDRELVKLGLQINDQVRAAHAEMEKARLDHQRVDEPVVAYEPGGDDLALARGAG